MRSGTSLWIRGGIGFLAAAIIVGYAYGRMHNLIAGPSITIVSPQNGSTLLQPIATIQGHAKHVATISLNGRMIFISKEGQLAENIVLAEGTNTLQLKGTDRFGRSVTTDLALVYKNPHASSTADRSLTYTMASSSRVTN